MIAFLSLITLILLLYEYGDIWRTVQQQQLLQSLIHASDSRFTMIFEWIEDDTLNQCSIHIYNNDHMRKTTTTTIPIVHFNGHFEINGYSILFIHMVNERVCVGLDWIGMFVWMNLWRLSFNKISKPKVIKKNIIIMYSIDGGG